MNEIGNEMPDENVLHVFLHIPKTSGTTVREFLKPHFTEDETLYCYGNDLFRRQRRGELHELVTDQTKLLFGHCQYGIHHKLARPVKYYTILRQPVARLISFYEYSKSRDLATTDVARLVKCARSNSILDFYKEFPNSCNEQCRFLANTLSNTADEALQNLKSMHFGLQDYTALFIGELAPQFGIRHHYFRSKKVRKKASVYAPHQIAALEQLCAEDMVLYTRAQQIYFERHNSSPALLNFKNQFLQKKASIVAKVIPARWFR